MGLGNRIRQAWNVFSGKEEEKMTYLDYAGGYYYRPDRVFYRSGVERSIISSIYNRIAIDVAAVDIRHVRLDSNGRYISDIDSNLNSCLKLSSNIDQTGRELIQDAVESLCDEGVIAIVPVDADVNADTDTISNIYSLRVGKIVEWYPSHVKVNLYNDVTGLREDVIVKKNHCSIVTNPLYSVMNEPNSTLKRLIRKLNILDVIDEQSGSGKLDLIIQLPYVIKTPQRKAYAETRRKDIEMQLAGSKYGIAYTDGTERITQLNRPAENNLMEQIKYLTSMLYGQLGITEEVINGTADEKTMLNYHNRTIEPIISSIVNEMKRKFLTKTARSQGQSISFFRDPFRLVPAEELANISDKLTRNEILSSNEVRAIIGYKPVDDPRADELRNKNLNADKNDGVPVNTNNNETDLNKEENPNDV